MEPRVVDNYAYFTPKREPYLVMKLGDPGDHFVPGICDCGKFCAWSANGCCECKHREGTMDFCRVCKRRKELLAECGLIPRSDSVR